MSNASIAQNCSPTALLVMDFVLALLICMSVQYVLYMYFTTSVHLVGFLLFQVSQILPVVYVVM